MSLALRILRAGPGVTLQDGGRNGYLRFGITVAGPMDPLAFATANMAARAARDATAIEVWLGGLELTAEGGPVSVAIAGGAFRLALGGCELPPAVIVRVEPKSRLSIQPGGSGAWCYVSVAGRIDVPPILGSASTHVRTGIGGFGGRMLAAGDLLPVSAPSDVGAALAEIKAPWLARPGDVIRVILGPQDDYFSSEQITAFLNGPWTLSHRSDRMAYLLEGRPLVHARGFNIVSDGIAMGAVQVPGDGMPVILMADRQPTGGYPKIANVIGADLGRVAQLRPGARFSFAAVSVSDAVAARRDEMEALGSPITCEPLMRTHFQSEFLLDRNLVDGVTDGAG